MNRLLWLLFLTSLAVLLASCGPAVTETVQVEHASTATPAAVAEQPATASTSALVTDEPTATAVAEEPTAAPEPVQTTREPTPTSAPPTEAPPTKAPSATPSGGLTAVDVQRITPAEASSLLDSGEAVLYDVRSAAAYNALHAVGALSWPEADAAARFGELQVDKSLIFYCT
jgi:hypothetical protein